MSEVRDIAQSALSLIEQLNRQAAEKDAAYMEIVTVAVRMAERLGPDDPDYKALDALLAFQVADSIERTKSLKERGK